MLFRARETRCAPTISFWCATAPAIASPRRPRAPIGAVDRAGANGEVEPGYGMTVIPRSICLGADAGQADGGLRRQARDDPHRHGRQHAGRDRQRRRAAGRGRHGAQFRRRLDAGPVGRHLSRAQQLRPSRSSAELEKIMDSGEGGPRPQSGEVPGHRTPERDPGRAAKPELLRGRRDWIARLDGSSATASTGVKVYRVQIRRSQSDRASC